MSLSGVDSDQIVTVFERENAVGRQPVGIWVDPASVVYIFVGRYDSDGKAVYGFESFYVNLSDLMALAAAANQVAGVNLVLREVAKQATRRELEEAFKQGAVFDA